MNTQGMTDQEIEDTISRLKDEARDLFWQHLDGKGDFVEYFIEILHDKENNRIVWCDGEIDIPPLGTAEPVHETILKTMFWHKLKYMS